MKRRRASKDETVREPAPNNDVWSAFYKTLSEFETAREQETAEKRKKFQDTRDSIIQTTNMGFNEHILPPEIWALVKDYYCLLLRKHYTSDKSIILRCDVRGARWCNDDHQCFSIPHGVQDKLRSLKILDINLGMYSYTAAKHCIFCDPKYRWTTYASNPEKPQKRSKSMFKSVKRHIDNGRSLFLLNHVLAPDVTLNSI